MGYTHYWYRKEVIPTRIFRSIVNDFKRLVPFMAENRIKLAGGLGTGEPEINDKEIWFNGDENCGHAKNDSISIPWPSRGAGGIGDNQSAQDGSWFAGASLETRCCNGDCSYETFVIPRIFPKDGYQSADDNGRLFACCKTAYRPYDIAVTAALIVAKHHLKDDLKVSSDGEDEHWFDAKMLCQTVLGYGIEYAMGDELKEASQLVG